MKTSIAQKAYIAGFLEGEGSFYLCRRMMRRKTVPDRYIIQGHISIRQKSRRPLDLIYKTYGGYISSIKTPNNGLIWHYSLNNSPGILELVKDVYPFLMSSRTRYRAACIYNLAKLKWSRGGRELLLQEDLDKREEVYEMWSKSRR